MTSSSCSPRSRPGRPDMIDFTFTAEQEEFRSELRRFAVTELVPNYTERAGTAAIQKRIIATSLLGEVATR